MVEREKKKMVPVTDSSRLKKHLVWIEMDQNTSIKHSVRLNDNFYTAPKYYEMILMDHALHSL
jgi:hypothetical protein